MIGVARLAGAVLIAGISLSAAASPFVDAADRLDGTWRGDDFVLRVDSHRAQASVEADRPFQWQRFLIREVSGDHVVFAVGSELFEAKFAPDGIVLTGSSFRGERNLQRQDAAAIR